MTLAKKQAEASSLLYDAARRISPSGAWTQKAFARTADGRKLCYENDPQAACWCAHGSLDLSRRKLRTSHDAYVYAFSQLVKKIGIDPELPLPIATWNDQPQRTSSEVVSTMISVADDLYARSLREPT